MNEESRKREIGSMHKLSDFEVFTWEIRNISSIPHVNDYVVKSPSFSYEGATWIFKMYPYGQTETKTGYIDLIIDRLHSQIAHVFDCKIYCKDFSDKEVFLHSEKYLLKPEKQFVKLNSLMKNVKEYPNKWKFAPNDVFTLICAIQKQRNLKARVKDFHKKSAVSAVADGNIQKTSMMLQNKVLQDFRELFLNRNDSDVIIKVKGQEFAAHSVILKARSPVLASTFRNDMKEKATGIVDVEDCDPSVFLDFLRFLYCGELENLSVENVFSLFKISDKYDVPDLRMNCINFMKSNLSVDTFCDTIALALLHSEDELKDLCIDFFAKNLQDIIVTIKWQSFILENPIQGNDLLIKVLVTNKK